MRFVVGGLVFAVFLADSLAAQEKRPEEIPAYRKRILGVYDERTGDAIEGADVMTVLGGLSARTTSTGTVSLAFVPDGGGLVRIRKVGFEPQTKLITITPDDTLPVTIVLKRVVELAAMNVTDTQRYIAPTLRGFVERMQRHATGYFIPDSSLRKEEARTIGNVLVAHIPNIVVKAGRGGREFVLKSPRCGAGGNPAVYLDNVLIAPTGGDSAVDIAQFSVNIIAGVEYYPTTSAAPVQFGGTQAGCGLLLLWTRER
jgi:hypothetical protein